MSGSGACRDHLDRGFDKDGDYERSSQPAEDERVRKITERRADGYEALAKTHGMPSAMITMLNDLNYVCSLLPVQPTDANMTWGKDADSYPIPVPIEKTDALADSTATEPQITFGPEPTTAGQKQVVIHDYGDKKVYTSQLPKPFEADDPPTSEAARAHGLRRIKRKHYDPDARNLRATTPPDFTEQARLVVEDWKRTLLVQAAPEANRDLIKRIASFASEAATQGQAVGIERAVEILNAGRLLALPEAPETAETLEKAAAAIHALSPDLDYLDRVRNEGATAALEQERKRIIGLVERMLHSDGFVSAIWAGTKAVKNHVEALIAAIGDD